MYEKRQEMINFEIHKKDIGLSNELHDSYKQLVRKKDCYQNIYRLTTNEHIAFKKNFRIAYGYILSVETVEWDFYVRHCFFINDKGMVIDPTLPYADHDQYYVVESYSFTEYINAICSNRETSLSGYKPLADKEMEFIMWAYTHNIACLS